MKLSAFMRKATGTRRKATSAGSCFSQASIVGSNELQCGQAYEKNSSTSTLPAGTPGGWGGSMRVKSLPSTGVACAKAGRPATSADAAAADRRVAEKRRRFMFVFMVMATVEGGFAPTRLVPRLRRTGGGRRWAAARSTRLHLDADRGDRLADLAQ